MRIKVDIKSLKYDEDYGKYEFVINKEGYIDLHIDEMMVDTIKDFEKFNEKNSERFEFAVDYLIEKWEVISKNKELFV